MNIATMGLVALTMDPRILTTIQSVVGHRFGVSVPEIRSASRTAKVALARHVAIWLGRALTGASYPELGQRTGGRDHSSAMHACRRIAALIGTDPAIRETVLSLRDRLAMNIPEGISVGRRMHLTFLSDPPRLLAQDRDDFEFSAAVLRRDDSGRPGPNETITQRGTLYVAVPPEARAAWAKVAVAAWHGVSIETAPNVYDAGKVLVTATGEEVPADVRAQLGEHVVTASVLLQLRVPG
ncbi:MAG: helix-turn-helix domain-containing protein [Rhodospirillaceae bacterium]